MSLVYPRMHPLQGILRFYSARTKGLKALGLMDKRSNRDISKKLFYLG